MPREVEERMSWRGMLAGLVAGMTTVCAGTACQEMRPFEAPLSAPLEARGEPFEDQGKQGEQGRPTAREVVVAIQEHVGVPWEKETVDTFKAGDPETRVTGIAVTMMATMDVLERASAKGLNFVITHEPTFYAHLDRPEGMPENDPVWAEKRAFIEKHGMVVWRFHDHWHMRKPDGIEAGMVHALGWEKYQSAENQFLFVLPETTLKGLAEEVAKKLDSPVVRVVGDAGDEGDEGGAEPGIGGIYEGDVMRWRGTTWRCCWWGRRGSGRRWSMRRTR